LQGVGYLCGGKTPGEEARLQWKICCRRAAGEGFLDSGGGFFIECETQVKPSRWQYFHCSWATGSRLRIFRHTCQFGVKRFGNAMKW